MTNTIVIGAGASGMAAAIAAAQRGERVTVLERNRKPMKKLAVTGNGRGNLLNSGAPQYFGDAGFALEVLRRKPFEEIAAFLSSCGVSLTEDPYQETSGCCHMSPATRHHFPPTR